MATYVKGDAVENATTYELCEVVAGDKWNAHTYGESIFEYVEGKYMNAAGTEWTEQAGYKSFQTTITTQKKFYCPEVAAGNYLQIVVRSGDSGTRYRTSDGTLPTSEDTAVSLSAGDVLTMSSTTYGDTAVIYFYEPTSEGATYNALATASEINFNLSEMGFATGNHTLVVKAKADGYDDSDYSNEVVYTVN